MPDTPPTLPAAITYLNHIKTLKPSPQLEQYLATLRAPKQWSIEVFIQGVEAFLKVANLTPKERADFYGNSFCGLHYRRDLAQAWNKFSAESIKAYQLNYFSPSEWMVAWNDAKETLVYRGTAPSMGLDKLIQGPTVIDCGMFAQLGMWFGFRHMLGDQLFNQIMGKVPLLLTQFCYVDIFDPALPWQGNPLFGFFSKTQEKPASHISLALTRVANHPFYPVKHPGTYYDGHNCIVIQGRYHIFDPTLEKKSSLDREEVESLLYDHFNASPTVHDYNKIEWYRQNPLNQETHIVGLNSPQLITEFNSLATFTLDQASWQSGKSLVLAEEDSFVLDFKKLTNWLTQRIAPPLATSISYTTLTAQQLQPPAELMANIPYENKAAMCFETFTCNTPLHQQLFQHGLQFCQAVMQQQARCLILTGEAGIGKTATAVSAAKELASRGKKVLWLSETLLENWTAEATALEDLEKYSHQLRALLTPDLDAVFMDDNNLIGFSGKLLLEETYRWYVTQPNKGLFITANHPITFKNCFGQKLDGFYHLPPFPGYFSLAFQNMVWVNDLAGPSLRPNCPHTEINRLTDDQKLAALSACTIEASVGVIVSFEAYEAHRHNLGSVEYIPGMSEREILTPIQVSLAAKQGRGPVYKRLSPIQQAWLQEFQIREQIGYHHDQAIRRPSRPSIRVKDFVSTHHSTIVLEIIASLDSKNCKLEGKTVDQLLKVINYAHDTGGKKVVLINRTPMTSAQVLENFQKKIPERERQRTLARLNQLLFFPALAAAAAALHNTAQTQMILHHYSASQPQPSVEKTEEAIVRDKKRKASAL